MINTQMSNNRVWRALENKKETTKEWLLKIFISIDKE